MPAVYLRKDLYDDIIRQNKDVASFINKAVAEAIEKLKKQEPKSSPAAQTEESR